MSRNVHTGMLANSHTGLVNANIRAPKRFFDLDRGHDPGTGASTTFHDVYFDARTDIEAGAELFVQYGDTWFSDREELGFIPLSYDFKVADKATNFLAEILANVTTAAKNHPQEFVGDFLNLTRQIAATRPRLANAFPKDLDSFEVATTAGTASLTVPNRVRTIEWLEKNGRCLDNIQPRISTIRQAGRGAFATRRIKKGDVITPMPLVHVFRRHMEIYDGNNYDDMNSSFWKDGKQLLLNYCYGHPDSSLLLFPYAPVSNYINHNVSRCNSELRWSDLPNHHDEWLLRSPDGLESESHAGLIMELVATKDIALDEEIFLNYGPQWESSWSAFLESRRLNDYDRNFKSSEALNHRIEWIRTVDEQEEYPYDFSNHEDVLTVCFVRRDNNLLIEETESMKTYRWSGADTLYSADHAYPCNVIDRSFRFEDVDQAYDRKDSVYPSDVTYTVLLTDDNIKIIDVPRAAIQFFDEEYMSDNSWRRAFRHEIHLPDHMVPLIWRDLRPTASENQEEKIEKML
jgi:SET domain